MDRPDECTLMGYGDEIMASHYARGAKARGKRIAFGDGEKIIWHKFAEEIFRHNPNVAPPGSEKDEDIEWVKHSYRGKRPYNHHFGNRWLWVPGFSNRPGEVFFSDEETRWAENQGSGFIVIEPNVPAFKSVGRNKQWAFKRYQQVANRLQPQYEVVQFRYPEPHGPGLGLTGTRHVSPPTFRHALAMLSLARHYIGPEGGLHHGAAAVGISATVIFGGFIPPQITGYATHSNLFSANESCGSIYPCDHCVAALNSISVDDVINATHKRLAGVIQPEPKA